MTLNKVDKIYYLMRLNSEFLEAFEVMNDKVITFNSNTTFFLGISQKLYFYIFDNSLQLIFERQEHWDYRFTQDSQRATKYKKFDYFTTQYTPKDYNDLIDFLYNRSFKYFDLRDCTFRSEKRLNELLEVIKKYHYLLFDKT